VLIDHIEASLGRLDAVGLSPESRVDELGSEGFLEVIVSIVERIVFNAEI
jgi:hypothetical protein